MSRPDRDRRTGARPAGGRVVGRLVLVGLGAATVAGVRAARRRLDRPEATTTNYRGRPVSLAGGPTLGVAATLSAAVAAPGLGPATLVAGFGAGAAGRYDDLARTRSGAADKGLAGHLRALRAGRVTSGVVKAAGITASALVAGALLPTRRRGVRRAVDTVLAAGVIAGAANLVNLFDLRPGRALKVGLLLGVPLAAVTPVAAGPVGAGAALLASDLAEETMLGDAGANSLGAVLGVALAARTGTVARALTVAALVALTVAGDRVSFTAVIDATPPLRWLDRWGRRG